MKQYKSKPLIAIAWLLLLTAAMPLHGQRVLLDNLFTFKEKNYALRVSQTADSKTTFTLSEADSGTTGTPTFRFDLNQYESFETPFIKRMNSLNASGLSGTDTANCKTIATQQFISIVKSAYVEPDEKPVAGWIKVKKVVPMIQRRNPWGGWVKLPDAWMEKEKQGIQAKIDTVNETHPFNPSNFNSHLLQKTQGEKLSGSHFKNKGRVEAAFQLAIIDSVQIEFRNGNLENIVVQAHDSNGRFLKFSNGIPISLDTKKHIDDFEKSFLFEVEIDNYAIVVADLFSYIENLQLNSQDYSPADQVIWIKPEEGRKKVYKQTTREILEGRVFSDFVGFDDSKPNGLIQTEVRRTINIFARRYIVSQRCDPRMFNFGFLTHLDLELGISKLERHNRAFPLQSHDSIRGGQLVQDRYITPTDLLQYENFQFGADLNLLSLEFQQFKSMFSLEAGFRFGRTTLKEPILQVGDSLTIDTTIGENIFTINTFRMHPAVKWEVFPDERYGFYFSYQPDFVTIAHPLVTLARGEEGAQFEKVSKLGVPVHRFEFQGHLNTGKSGRLFFRYRFHSLCEDLNFNFHQAQIGYSFFILAAKK